MNERG
ncbi:unnamed protein product, partial [Cuscuta europaea]